jgi:hypothetical protein
MRGFIAPLKASGTNTVTGGIEMGTTVARGSTSVNWGRGGACTGTGSTYGTPTLNCPRGIDDDNAL